VIVVFVPTRFDSDRVRDRDEKFDLHDFVKGVLRPTRNRDAVPAAGHIRRPLASVVSGGAFSRSVCEEHADPVGSDALDADTLSLVLLHINRRPRLVSTSFSGAATSTTLAAEGPKYRPDKGREPADRGKNAFLSTEDARRVGETIRQLFSEAETQAASRVVIHKRTPFLRAERDGLRQGLAGVDAIDMLEINIDDALRYVSSVVGPTENSTKNYPVEGADLSCDRAPMRRFSGCTVLRRA